jgi:putative transposase
MMKNAKSLYHGHRFPAAVISFVSYETVRRWCDKFGAGFAHRVKAARRRPGTTWHLDAEASRQGCSEAVFQTRACLLC